MRENSKWLLVGLGLLLAMYGIANGSDDEMAAPCGYIRNHERCEGYPSKECTWNHGEDKCISSDPPEEDRCRTIMSYYRCIKSSFGCFWDETSHRCEKQPKPQP